MNPHHRDDELLSAYLAAELDDAATAELEARLAADAALRARLDGVHDVVVALRGLDDVDPPAGYARRLRERLDTERGTAVPGQVVSLDPVRARRRGTWRSVGTAAAALVFVAAIGTAVARWDGRVDGGGGDLAAVDLRARGTAAVAGRGGGRGGRGGRRHAVRRRGSRRDRRRRRDGRRRRRRR
jgi:anti-sigma factor RsiW